MSSKKFITVKRKGNKQAVPISKRKPYGIQRELAYDEVQKLRKEGNKARLIETNRKRNLYAAYEGTIPVETKQSSENTGDNKNVTLKTETPINKKRTYKEVYENMKLVPISLRLSGEPRKGSIYAAIITGTDPKYGLKREFLNGDRTYSGKHDLTVDYSANLKPGTIIETGAGGSWKNKYGSYYIVTNKGLRQLESNYNGSGRLIVKDLIKAREKALGKFNEK